jgi:hypothetical protein
MALFPEVWNAGAIIWVTLLGSIHTRLLQFNHRALT